MFAWVPLLAAGLTTLCCLGVSAALSLATAVGATFLTEDSTLRPILAVTLTMTVAASALTYWRHRLPGPLLVTTLAAVGVYTATYVGGGGQGHSDHGDHAPGHDSAQSTGGLSSGRSFLVWAGLALLVGAQAWDLVRVRRAGGAGGAARSAIEAGDEPSDPFRE